jgi:hypothetical protein
MPNELSGQPVYVDASKIVELFTPKAENTGSADDRDLDALAVEDISVHGKSPISPSPSARARRGGRSVILLLQNHPDDEDQSGDDADLNP